MAGLGVVEECGDQATSFQAGQRVVCVPSKAWSALDGSGTWQQACRPPQSHHSACSQAASAPALSLVSAVCLTCLSLHLVEVCTSYIAFPALQVMLVPEANLYPVPDEVTDSVAAQFSVSVLVK